MTSSTGREITMPCAGVFSPQEEQEFVMIVVPREKKCEIMSAITTSCGLKTPAHGMVISLPVDDVMGLEQ